MVKEYIVSLNVSFTTPVGVNAPNKSVALSKAKALIKNSMKQILNKELIDDYVDLNIEEDYVEEQ